jgi:hypothetical protein
VGPLSAIGVLLPWREASKGKGANSRYGFGAGPAPTIILGLGTGDRPQQTLLQTRSVTMTSAQYPVLRMEACYSRNEAALPWACSDSTTAFRPSPRACTVGAGSLSGWTRPN